MAQHLDTPTEPASPANTYVESPWISREELVLAARNHAMPLEALRYEITPVGLHYLLIHFDIPQVDPSTFALEVAGRVSTPLSLSLDDLRSRPTVRLPVTMECAGNGRALLSRRPVSQPWLSEAVGTAEWTGTPLRGVLEEAGLLADAVEVVFTGLDRGVEQEFEHSYERSLSPEDALREEVLLAYEINGVPLPPQHGFPLRLLVPGWYGMTSVKWLHRITVVSEPFRGFQMTRVYRIRETPEEEGRPITRLLPRSLMAPPGIPEYLSRSRIIGPGPVVLRGRAWSGWGPIERVEVSTDGGRTWNEAELGEAPSDFAWFPWSHRWEPPGPGTYEVASRATDAAGNVQPEEAPWNVGGYQNNAVQRTTVIVRE